MMPERDCPAGAGLRIDAQGWCAGACHVPSPNCDGRQEGVAIDLLVIHNISLPPGVFGGSCIEALFCNTLDYAADPYFEQLRSLRVSSHFLIRRDGSLVQFVATLKRAWHAGVSSFEGRPRCNDFSIGIELEGTDDTVFEAGQYDTLVRLTCALQVRHGLQHVTGHADIAPGRKTDPGPLFDWEGYHNGYRQATVATPPLRFAGTGRQP